MECIWKKRNSVKSFVSSISRLFHHLANANQKEALFLKSCTEVKTERRYRPKVLKKKSLKLCSWISFNAKLVLDLCKWGGGLWWVYLRGLCEVPVCWLDFGPYPSVCIRRVAAAAPLPLVPGRLLVVTWHHHPGSRKYRLDSVRSMRLLNVLNHVVLL